MIAGRRRPQRVSNLSPSQPNNGSVMTSKTRVNINTMPMTVRLMPSSAYSGGKNMEIGKPRAAIVNAGDAKAPSRNARIGSVIIYRSWCV